VLFVKEKLFQPVVELVLGLRVAPEFQSRKPAPRVSSTAIDQELPNMGPVEFPMLPSSAKPTVTVSDPPPATVNVKLSLN